MKSSHIQSYIWFFLRIALGGLFVYASYYKIISPGSFAHEIYNYKLLPSVLINPIAIFLPWVQLFCGLALITGFGKQGGALIITIMMAVFQVAVASALIRGLDVSCGCFEAGGNSASWWTFARDLMFLLLAITILWKETRPEPDGLWWRGKI